jgi:hypothetical protein
MDVEIWQSRHTENAQKQNTENATFIAEGNENEQISIGNGPTR